jgi:hypothetical protein
MADTPATPAAPAAPAAQTGTTNVATPPGSGAAGANAPEDLRAKAERLYKGNPIEFEKAMIGGTPTEQAALKAYKAEMDAANKQFVLSGAPGSAFSVDGPGLGTGGTLTVNGVVVPTTRWDDRSIRGILPVDAKPGPVVIQQTGGKTLNGKYGK